MTKRSMFRCSCGDAWTAELELAGVNCVNLDVALYSLASSTRSATARLGHEDAKVLAVTAQSRSWTQIVSSSVPLK